MRLLILTAESLDVARGSGTAMAIIQLRRALASHGVAAPAVSTPRHAALPASRGLAALARRQRLLDYDAILGVDGVGCEVAEAHGLPFVALIKALFIEALPHEHGVTRLRLGRRTHQERAGARYADAVIVPSQFAADTVVRRYGVGASRIHVIPEPFDAAAWRSAMPQRTRSGDRVLCVAHLYPRKRVIDLVHAWSLVTASRPDARLDIVGDGPELRRLARASSGLRGCYMHGHVDHPELAELYARADSFCLPSAQETFGYAAVEAMASGLPLVVADAGALPELCQGAVCETVPWGAPDELAAALLRSLDAGRRGRAAAINPQRLDAFAPPIVARRVVQVVEACWRAGSAPRRRQ